MSPAAGDTGHGQRVSARPVAGRRGPPGRRATGASLAAILSAGFAFVAVMVLHALRRDLDPYRQAMSEYANGSHGLVMTVAFYAFGLAVGALALRLRGAIALRGAARPISGMLALASVALVVSGIFEVGEPKVPDSLEETMHSAASVGAFVLLVAAMLLLSVACRRDARWWSFRWVCAVLAMVAAVAAMASPVVDGAPWSGAVQRLLGLTILLWVLLTALRIRSNAFRPSR